MKSNIWLNDLNYSLLAFESNSFSTIRLIDFNFLSSDVPDFCGSIGMLSNKSVMTLVRLLYRRCPDKTYLDETNRVCPSISDPDAFHVFLFYSVYFLLSSCPWTRRHRFAFFVFFFKTWRVRRESRVVVTRNPRRPCRGLTLDVYNNIRVRSYTIGLFCRARNENHTIITTYQK